MKLKDALAAANQLHREQNQNDATKYRKMNREKVNEYRRRWYLENRDACLEKNKEYYWANKEEISKRRCERRNELKGQNDV